MRISLSVLRWPLTYLVHCVHTISFFKKERLSELSPWDLSSKHNISNEYKMGKSMETSSRSISKMFPRFIRKKWLGSIFSLYIFLIGISRNEINGKIQLKCVYTSSLKYKIFASKGLIAIFIPCYYWLSSDRWTTGVITEHWALLCCQNNYQNTFYQLKDYINLKTQDNLQFQLWRE